MKGGGIEIRTVGPHQRPRLRVQDHPPEHGLVSQRSEKLAVENGLEVDYLFGMVIERYGQRVRPDNLEPGDSMDGMHHGAT